MTERRTAVLARADLLPIRRLHLSAMSVSVPLRACPRRSARATEPPGRHVGQERPGGQRRRIHDQHHPPNPANRSSSGTDEPSPPRSPPARRPAGQHGNAHTPPSAPPSPGYRTVRQLGPQRSPPTGTGPPDSIPAAAPAHRRGHIHRNDRPVEISRKRTCIPVKDSGLAGRDL
jgi:hypothetical protein